MELNSDRGAQVNLSPEDSVLVEALRRGDESAFSSLVERYHPALVRLALAHVHDRALAEEVAQEAWLGMLQGVHRFAGRATLKTWLFRILVNCARASLRREGRAIPFSDLSDPSGDGAPSVDPDRFHPSGHRWTWHWSGPPGEWPEATLLEAEMDSFLRRAIAQLPTSQRTVLTLRDIDGWTAAETCAVLGISAANQRVLLHRARSRVRHEIEAYLDHAGEDDHGHH